MGKLMVIAILLAAVAVGGAVFYGQVFAYYHEVAASGPNDVRLMRPDGAAEPVIHADFQAIDADSSPIRYRACFTTGLTPDDAAARYDPYPAAEPNEAPFWFRCFNADRIGHALETGHARAFLSVSEIHPGIDRVIAIDDSGHGYAWHQINHCGEALFNGRPAPDGCAQPSAQEGL